MQCTLRRIPLVILCASIYIFASQPVTAQSGQKSQASASVDGNSPESNICHTTLTFGSGASKFKICITNHGNLFDLESPAGFEHLTPSTDNTAGDGYVLCSTGAIHGFDSGFDEGGWGAPTITQPGGANTLPLTIVRTTTNGKFQLSQSFDWDTAKKEVTITMVLRNVSASAITSVQLARYFDGDISNDFADDRYDADADSVWGRDVGSGAGHHGLMLTALSFAQPHTTAVETFDDWNPTGVSKSAKACTPSPQPVPTAPDDYVGRLTFNLGTIGAGAAKTIIVLYKRF